MAEMDAEVRAQLETLKGVSRAELSARDQLHAIESLAPDAWKKYVDTAAVINDYINLFDGGEEVDQPEWHRALGELGEDRRDFARKAIGAIQSAEDGAASHLASERADLDKVLKALEDVKSAIHDGEEAQRLTGVIFKLKELAEFAEKPSVMKAVNLVRNKTSHDEQLIEEGIGNLAQYGVDLTLVEHGFSSLDELQRRVKTARDNVDAAAATLEHYDHQHQLAAQYEDWAPQG